VPPAADRERPDADGRLPFGSRAPGFLRAMIQMDRAATKELDLAGIDPRVRELIRIAAVAAASGEQEGAALISLIVMINAWNAVGVATRAWEPGSYQP
jgi:alkylhydroperoxidase/carboxymuconolactone decarboxylase family protein YurZ